MGTAVGGAVGGLAVIVALIGLLAFLRRRKRAKTPAVVTMQTNNDVEMTSTSTSGADPFPSTGFPQYQSSLAEVSKPGSSAGTHTALAVGQPMKLPVEPAVVGTAFARTPFPMHEWEFASSELDWTNSQEIGRGAFGVVHDVLCATLHIAAKRMDVSVGRQRADLERLLRREFRTLQRALHANVVRVLGVVVDNPNYVCLLTELAHGGSLRMLLDMTAERVVGQPMMQLNMTHDIAHGMDYLHSFVPPIIHHDLKPENVLLFSGDQSKAFTAKISDFGLASGISTTSFGASSFKAGGGTTAYKAPETFDDTSTPASDVYSFGIVCWELLSGDRPWAGKSDVAILGAVCNRGERPPMPSAPPTSDTPPSVDVFAMLSNLVQRCWLQEEENRPKFSQMTRQLELAVSQMKQLRVSLRRNVNPSSPPDVFISFRFAEVPHSRIRTTSETCELPLRCACATASCMLPLTADHC